MIWAGAIDAEADGLRTTPRPGTTIATVKSSGWKPKRKLQIAEQAPKPESAELTAPQKPENTPASTVRPHRFIVRGGRPSSTVVSRNESKTPVTRSATEDLIEFPGLDAPPSSENQATSKNDRRRPIRLTGASEPSESPVENPTAKPEVSQPEDERIQGRTPPPSPEIYEEKLDVHGVDPEDRDPFVKSLTFSIDELEELALEYNPTLREAHATYDRGYGQFEQVGLYPNPVVSYQGSEIGNDGKGGQQGALLSQEIVTADKLRWNRSVANQNLERLNWQIETQTQRVRNDVRIRFYEALQAQLTVKAAMQLVELAQEGVRLAKALFEAQDGARIDVLQAEIELNQVQIVLQSAENSQVATWRRLAYAIGLPDLPFTMLSGSLEGEIPQYEFDELWTKLADEHPQLQAASARINQASQQIQRERVQPIPNVDVQFGVQKDYASNYTVAQAQIGVALPIYNRNQGNIYSAFAEMQRAEAERERLELWYRDQLADVYRDFATARQRVERYQHEILPRARENLDLTTAGYQQGEYAFLRVLVARETYFQSRLEYLRAWTALRVAEVRLTGFTLTGGLDAADE